RRAVAVEVVALDIEAVDVPARSGRDDEVIGGLVVERVVRPAEVLRARRVGAQVVVLVVEDASRWRRGSRRWRWRRRPRWRRRWRWRRRRRRRWRRRARWRRRWRSREVQLLRARQRGRVPVAAAGRDQGVPDQRGGCERALLVETGSACPGIRGRIEADDVV